MISRKIKSVLAVALLVGAPFAAQAGTTGASVNVQATLTPGCTASVGGGTGVFTYAGTSNAAITNAAHQTVTFTCTRGLTLTSVAWDTTNGSNTSSGTGDTVSATTSGTVAGLVYTLATGTAAVTAGNAASGNTTGATATTYVYSITRSLDANQPGDASASATATRTLTLSY